MNPNRVKQAFACMDKIDSKDWKFDKLGDIAIDIKKSKVVIYTNDIRKLMLKGFSPMVAKGKFIIQG